MIAFLLVCLCITLISLEHYVISGFHASTHRLLPLLLGLMAVYDYYLIVEYISDYDEVFVILKDLLLMQVFFLILVYIMDFMKIKLPFGAVAGSFVFYTIANVLVCTQINIGEKYRTYILWFVMVSVFLTMAIATWAFVKKRITRMEHEIYGALFILMLVPAIVLILVMLGIVVENIFMPLSLAFSCVVMNILLAKGIMVETENLLIDDTFNISEIPTLLFDKDMYFLGANEAAREVFSDYVEQLMDKKRLKKFWPYLREWINSESDENEVCLNNRYYKVNLSRKYVKSKIRGYVVQVYDITYEKAQLKEKSDFLAHMSHDLRSPLHAIISGSEVLLSRNEMSVRSRVMMQNIKSAGEDLLEIVNAILEYSKLEAGKLELKIHKYNFKQLLMEQMNICNVNVGSKPISVKLELQTSYPEFLCGDEMRIREMIQNLLSNASKFTEEGEIICRVWTSINEDDVEVKIEVEDTGCGIEEKRLSKIMDEYSSFSKDYNKEGTGLGLSIIKQLTGMMSGNVTLWSRLGEGTRVAITFHQKLLEGQILESDIIDDFEAGVIFKEWTDRVIPTWVYPEARILLADDMEVNREIFKDYSKLWQVNVDCASNGEDALRMASENDYQLIVLDLMMPKMCGDEAAKEIRKLKNVPIIALSANEISYEVFDDCLLKPLQPKELQPIMEKYIPEEYRENPPIIDDEINVLGMASSLESYCRTLNTYIREVTYNIENLEDYFVHDIDLFRTKVHGIKGISRQLEKLTVAESAEIMEMAAKAGHISYIENHLESFIDGLKIVLDECQKEIEYNKNVLTRYNNFSGESVNGKLDRDDKVIHKLIEEIKKAFSSFDIIAAEKSIEEVNRYELLEEEIELLKNAKIACEEFDYEKGEKLFEKY